ncbi:MAG TPA: NUDIX hydrolase [Planctomycetota bacterium]|nr:NUDIX hydrolase [Planctomycetota bacterium]
MNEKQTVACGKFLKLVKDGRWEYAERVNSSGAVAIVAVTDEGKLILVEQFRVPLGKRSIELPAGLAGDDAGKFGEALANAATRELLEETGYEAGVMEFMTEGASSAGLTSETIAIFRARHLKKVGAGGGDAQEDILVHEIPLTQVPGWIAQQRAAGKEVDLKVFAGLWFAGK